MTFSSTNISSVIIGVCIFLTIGAVIIFLIVFFVVLNKKRNNRVLLASPYLKEIEDINKKYSFHTFTRTIDTKAFCLNSKRAFDNFDFNKRKAEYIKDKFSRYQEIVRKIDINISLFSKYKKELSLLKTTSDESLAKANKMSLESFRKREVKLGSKLVKTPQMSYSLRIKWEYTSPAGRNHYSNYKDYSYSEIKSEIQQLAIIKSKTHSLELSTRGKPKEQPSQKIYTNDDIEDIED